MEHHYFVSIIFKGSKFSGSFNEVKNIGKMKISELFEMFATVRKQPNICHYIEISLLAYRTTDQSV